MAINIGTTNSVAAIVDGNQPMVIANKAGKRLVPSIGVFKRDEPMVVVTVKRKIKYPIQDILTHRTAER